MLDFQQNSNKTFMVGFRWQGIASNNLLTNLLSSIYLTRYRFSGFPAIFQVNVFSSITPFQAQNAPII